MISNTEKKKERKKERKRKRKKKSCRVSLIDKGKHEKAAGRDAKNIIDIEDVALMASSHPHFSVTANY